MKIIVLINSYCYNLLIVLIINKITFKDNYNYICWNLWQRSWKTTTRTQKHRRHNSKKRKMSSRSSYWPRNLMQLVKSRRESSNGFHISELRKLWARAHSVRLSSGFTPSPTKELPSKSVNEQNLALNRRRQDRQRD